MFSWLFRADSGADDRSVFGDFWFEPVSARSAAGVRVSADQALRLSTVYRCVRVLAGTMSSLPLCFYVPDGRGRKRDTTHPLYRVLARKPNRFQNSFEWHQMMVSHLSLRGTGYNRIVANGRGDIEELIPLNPDRMSVQVLDSKGSFRYCHKQDDGSEEILEPGKVFKLCGISANGYTGLNPMQLGSDSVGEGLAQQDYSARFFRNDARPLSGWLEYPGDFRDDAARIAFRDSYQKVNSGANRGKMVILDRGMKYHELGVNNRDAQMLEAKNAKVADICRWFGVPPHLAFALDRATDNNIERLSLEFIKFTMRELAECFEAAYEDQLLGEDETVEAEYDMDKLARGEMKSRAEYYQLGVQGGWLTRNEARAMEGLNPLDELDEPLQPLNMVPAGTPPEESDPAPQPSEDEGAAARGRAMTLAEAGRVVRKETSAMRKAFERACKSSAPAPAWLEAVALFYASHVEYVAKWLCCDEAVAAAWCERQRAELEGVTWDSAIGTDTIPALLEAWDATAAAELAARCGVHASAQSGSCAAPRNRPTGRNA